MPNPHLNQLWSLPRYGSPDDLLLVQRPLPNPLKNQIRVRVHNLSINAGDLHLVGGNPWLARPIFGGFRRPKFSPGMDVAGVVDAIGDQVTRFKLGDPVAADLSGSRFSGFATTVCASEQVWAPIPRGVSFEDAAATPVAAVTALQALRDHGQLRPGERVWIRGASSGVGSFAVQIAALLAGSVTASCRPEKRPALAELKMVTWLDGDEPAEPFDLIIDHAAYTPLTKTAKRARKGGRYVLVGGSNFRFFQVLLLKKFLSIWTGRSIRTLAAQPSPTDLEQLFAWIGAGSLKPIIGRRYRFDQIPQALTAMKNREIAGKAVISLD
ncbi:MAG: NAD(P)-dependent alcohol dehydrogenase [Puniceicoccaceae bacterium]